MTQPRPKVAYVAAHLPSYYALEHDVFGRSRRGLEGLAAELDFELLPVPEPVVGAEDARRARRALEAAGADLVLLQSSTFAMGDVVTQFAGADFRLGLWAVEEPTHDGPVLLNNFVSLNLNAGILRHYFRTQPQPYKWFFGLPGHPWFAPRLRVTVAALRALRLLRDSRIALVGGVAPTFYNFVNDPRKLAARLGTRVEELELDEVFRRMPKDSGRLRGAMDAMAGHARGRVEISAADFETTAAVYLALQDLAREGYAALAVSDWPRFQTELGIHPGMAFSWLDESDGVPVASEGDVLGAVTMLMLRAVSQQGALLLDFTDLDLERGAALAWHCGGSPLGLADEEGVTWKNHSTLGRKAEGAVPRGAVADFRFRPGAVTLARVSGDTERLFFAEAEAFEGVSRGFEGSRGWLRDFRINHRPAALADLVNTIMAGGIEHHFGLVAGRHADALAEVAAWSGLKPVDPAPYRDFLAPLEFE
ncbi:MAG: hypothetical protein SFU83_12470 [Meiothermus sp.]|nr:hypothetical protein [Meiothermus sp.]